MKRLQIGLIALALLIAAAVRAAMISKGGWDKDIYLGSLLRSGLFLAALWLALPTLTVFFTKTPKWILVGLVVGVILFMIRPGLLWWIPALMLGIWFVNSRFGIGQIATGAGPARAPRRPKRKT